MLAYTVGVIVAKCGSINPVTSIVFCLSACQLCMFVKCLYDDFDDYTATIQRKEVHKLENAMRSFEKELKNRTDEFEREKLKINNENQKLRQLLNSSHPFHDVAKMKTVIDTVIFQDSINYLKYKHHPAPTAAEEVRRMKQISSKILMKSKEIEYKYDYILSAFPEISEYVSNDKDLISVGEQVSYLELDDMRDRRKDYLSSDEYAKLSDAERSQLALDRYIAKRSKWQIGRDYEMSCAFQLKTRGYKVEMHGIKYKKADLGRDLIAYKWNRWSAEEVLIIQCKNWSHDRMIHENVIMQLLGTTIEYQITLGCSYNREIVPVLMIPPYSVISDVAVQFANKLNVRIERMKNIDFPRIKCNINNGNKIYHLPFDQQYDRAEIKLKGECFAYTVAEAESKGFRRAMRHHFTR